MKISKHQPDEEGLIHIIGLTRLLTMGLQDDIPTVWAMTDSNAPSGQRITFIVKYDGDDVTLEDAKTYITSFISSKSVWHLFGEEQKIIRAGMTPPGPMRP